VPSKALGIVVKLGSQVYPDVAPEFGRLPFSVIEQLAGYHFKDVDDPTHPKFMSHERFQALIVQPSHP